MRLALISVSVLGLASCAAKPALLTVTSWPPGAMLMENEGSMSGIGEVVSAYKFSESARDESGCFGVKGWTALWASGTSTTTDRITLCRESDGRYEYVLRRDPEAPDTEVDLRAALHYGELRAAERQAMAAERQAEAQNRAAWAAVAAAAAAGAAAKSSAESAATLQRIESNNSRLNNSKPFTCTTKKWLNGPVTTCHQ